MPFLNCGGSIAKVFRHYKRKIKLFSFSAIRPKCAIISAMKYALIVFAVLIAAVSTCRAQAQYSRRSVTHTTTVSQTTEYVDGTPQRVQVPQPISTVEAQGKPPVIVRQQPMQKCPRCKGEGVVKEWADCEVCAGAGYVPDGVYVKYGISGRTATQKQRRKRCDACKGSMGWAGKVKRDVQCPRCNGSGSIPK